MRQTCDIFVILACLVGLALTNLSTTSDGELAVISLNVKDYLTLSDVEISPGSSCKNGQMTHFNGVLLFCSGNAWISISSEKCDDLSVVNCDSSPHCEYCPYVRTCLPKSSKNEEACAGYFSSCASLLDSFPSLANRSGVYPLNISSNVQNIYCDLSSLGQGSMLAFKYIGNTSSTLPAVLSQTLHSSLVLPLLQSPVDATHDVVFPEYFNKTGVTWTRIYYYFDPAGQYLRKNYVRLSFDENVSLQQLLEASLLSGCNELPGKVRVAVHDYRDPYGVLSPIGGSTYTYSAPSQPTVGGGGFLASKNTEIYPNDCGQADENLVDYGRSYLFTPAMPENDIDTVNWDSALAHFFYCYNTSGYKQKDRCTWACWNQHTVPEDQGFSGVEYYVR